MSRRAYLHDLTQQLRRYLRWQEACGVEAFVPADDEERRALEARKRLVQQRKVEQLKEGLAQDGHSGRQKARPRAERPVQNRRDQDRGADSRRDQNRRGQNEASAVEQQPRDNEASSAPPAETGPSITAKTPIWKKHRAIHEIDEEKRQRSETSSKARSTAEVDEAPQNPETPAEKLAFLRQYLGDCQRCPLHRGRTNVVFGDGNPEARLLFVGEGPGREEDRQGLPFVGASGQLLTRMIEAMGLRRQDVYIANVVKCRPPANRDPAPLEIKECAPFLRKQIEVIGPEVIVTVGRFATNTLLGKDDALGRMRGRWHEYMGIAVMPTYHPAYLLRNEGNRDLRSKSWSDLQMVMDKLGLATES